MAQSKFIDHREARPHAVPEGDEAVEKIVAILRAQDGNATVTGDLPQALERLARSLGERHPSALLGEMLSLKRQNPDAFLAGALAGLALGRGPAAEEAAGDDDSAHPGPGIVTAPITTAQTGSGGLGYLEAPPADMPAKRKR